MTPEQFLKKWLPVAEHVFKDMKLTMKDDLEAVIRAYQNVIDRQAEDLRCFENQGHIESGHVTDSPFCFPNFIKYGNDFGIKRPDTPRLDFDNATREPIGDTGYTAITVPLNFDRPDNSIKSESGGYELTHDEYQEALKNRELKSSEERMREFDDEFLKQTHMIDYKELAIDLFYALQDEILDEDRHALGVEDERDYEIDGFKFTISVDGFWEKSTWFNYQVRDQFGDLFEEGSYHS